MWYLVGLILALCFLSLLVYFARQEGKKSERIEALKREAKERAREQQITSNVYSLTPSEARNKLHDIANKLNK